MPKANTPSDAIKSVEDKLFCTVKKGIRKQYVIKGIEVHCGTVGQQCELRIYLSKLHVCFMLISFTISLYKFYYLEISIFLLQVTNELSNSL